MSAVEIRPAQTTDAEAFNRCVGAVARERRYLALVDAPALESSKDWVASRIKQNEPFFLAVHEGDVVGWIDIRAYAQEGFTHRGELGMGLLADFRGRGIGRRLLDAALTKASEIGIEIVELDVFAGNTRAIRLYEAHGFVVDGRRVKGRKIDGAYEDVVMMAKTLAVAAR